MNNYNFGELLSPLRFEQISRDLLSEEYGVVFENFAEGKDGGIDFRYSKSKNNVLIVQCKRYNNFNNLTSTLTKEVEKIKKLSFSTYILVTSLKLTGKNKEKIVNTLENKIQPKDIITGDDLNYLLSKPSNHHIEFKYPELWMKSINIHQKIFHLGFLEHSRFIADKMQSSLINFVPVQQYYQVINHFEKNNVVIISGNPGIGKTTLSYAVISHYIHTEKCQLIDLSYRTIQEAESFIYQEEPAIFFIDDFLGKIKLEKNKNNDYSQLLLFLIEKIENTSNKKLIITSREYILRQGIKDLFPVNEINRTISKYVIELKSFTRSIRTEILYNHLKSSNLPLTYIDKLLEADFKRIIDHENYNPRIIEELTNVKLLKNIDAEVYFNFFMENLRNPLKVWKNVYDKLPNKLYKLTIITKFLIEGQLPLKHLEKAVNSVIEKSNEYHAFSYDEFEYIMKDLEGTFFTFQDGYDESIEEEYTLVEFQNPSVIDFIDNFIWEKPFWLNLIIKNAIYFEQLFNSRLADLVKDNPTLHKSFREKILEGFNNLENANIGYFMYETDEDSFECWAPARHYYYLNQLISVISVDEDEGVANFLKKEIFRYPFDGAEDVSEKESFCQVASVLINTGYIEGKDAIKHYTSGFLNHTSELLCFLYMLRECDEEALKLVENNKKFAEDVDTLLYGEVNTLEEKNVHYLSDFFYVYEQVRYLLPLTKTTKKLKQLDTDILWDDAYKQLSERLAMNKATRYEEVKDENYFDIDDESIDNLFETIKEKRKTIL